MNTNWNNVAPRIGFAWTPRGSAHPTTVRGGYGIFYVLPVPRLYNNFVENAPFSPSVTLNRSGPGGSLWLGGGQESVPALCATATRQRFASQCCRAVINS
jgi:hypothetical protein